MNLACVAGGADKSLLFVNFSQDCASVSVGTKNGFQLFSLFKDKVEKIYSNDVDKDVCMAERLFSSSLIALVTLTHPLRLKVCHFKKGTEICNTVYPKPILNVKLNRQRLVVCLEDSIYIHNIRDMKIIHTLSETPRNPRGLIALTACAEHSYLAYPGNLQNGTVQIFDTITMKAVSSIPAHDNPLAAIAFSFDGTKLASASDKGTVIRVFSVSEGAKLLEFRRGVKRCVAISSLSFSMDGQFLSASSNTETIHVFRLKQEDKKMKEDEQHGWTEYVTNAFKTSAAYLPSQVTEVFSQWRAFATARLAVSGYRTICALCTVQKVMKLLVVSEDGLFHLFNVDTVEGGDCTLAHTARIDAMDDQPTIISPKPAENPILSEPLVTKTPQNDMPLPASDDKAPVGDGVMAYVGDATYAYKLKRNPRRGPSTTSQELGEIVDNVRGA